MGYPAGSGFLFIKRLPSLYIFFMVLILLTALLWIKHIDLDAMMFIAQQKWETGEVNLISKGNPGAGKLSMQHKSGLDMNVNRYVPHESIKENEIPCLAHYFAKRR